MDENTSNDSNIDEFRYRSQSNDSKDLECTVSNPEYHRLLEKNYQNLHTSLWEAHKITWTVTNIFIPVLFAGTGFVFRDAFEKPYTVFQSILVGLLGELLILVWWLLMQMFENYNDTRRERLKNIETFFARQFKKNEFYPIQQYKLDYTRKVQEFKFSFSWISNFCLIVYVSIICCFVGTNYISLESVNNSQAIYVIIFITFNLLLILLNRPLAKLLGSKVEGFSKGVKPQPTRSYRERQ